MRHNVLDLHKSNMFTEISSPRPPKRMRSSFFMDSDMGEEQTELPHLETSKKPKGTTVSSPVEARTPLGEEALDTFNDSQSDLDVHSQSATVIPTTKHTEETLVEPNQHQEQIVTPKSPLKHQKQVESAPQTPLPLDKSVNEMPIRRKSTSLNVEAQPPTVTSPGTSNQIQQDPVASPKRLTRRQAKLIQENGGNPEFAVPEVPPPKRRGRASKPNQIEPKQPEPEPEQVKIIEKEEEIQSEPKQVEMIEVEEEIQSEPKKVEMIEVEEEMQSEPKQVEMIEVEEEMQPLKETSVQEQIEMRHVEDMSEEAIVEQQQGSLQVIDADNAPDVDMKTNNAPEEAIVEEEETNKIEKSKEDLQEEKLRAYRKQKSDAEIKTILEAFPQLAHYYQLIERAGSGTFSRVYKAKDLLADEYVPWDQEEKPMDALENDADAKYVAIKLIFDISKPERVMNEIRCLSLLKESPGITPLITAFRHEGLTFVVLPYIQFDHFDDFYRSMTADDVRSYISELLIGLKSTHEKGYMHRDVKPGNFLYNIKSKSGYLADFGLARAFSTKSTKQQSTSIKVKNSQYTQKEDEIGYYAYDTRSPLQADRSGTKGFRAPEVMLRYRYQTSAIDIWAVGVILLTILSGRYPIFEPEDDANGIMELAHVFGIKKMKEFTEYYGRIIHTNIPTIPEDPVDLATFCRDINKEGVEKWDQQEYASAVDLMKHCLQLIHTNRPTAADALNHPFFTSKKDDLETTVNNV
ncbi:Cell division control protein 7 [Mucor circinelloides]